MSTMPDATINEFVRIKEQRASDAVTDKITSYGIDVLIRMFPSAIDGLKAIHRRILFVMADTRDKVSFMSQLGNIMNLHQAGDGPIYQAIVRIGQDFKIGEPLIRIFGEEGSYADNMASQPRYLGIAISQFGADVFFNSCNRRTLPMTYSKDLRATEPIYLVPCIPTALLLGHLTVGLGIGSSAPQLNLNSVCDLVVKQAEYRKSTKNLVLPSPKIAPYLIPDYPIDNLLRNKPQLIEQYSAGNYQTPIYLDGNLTIKDQSIIVHTIAANATFRSVMIKLIKQLIAQKSKHWLYDLLRNIPVDHSTKEGHIAFNFKNGVNIFEILDKFKKTIRFQGVFHPRYNYLIDRQVHAINPRQLLQIWYDERSRSILGDIKYSHSDALAVKLRLTALMTVVDYLDEVIAMIRASDTEATAIQNLKTRFPDLSQSQALIISKMPIIKLTKQSKLNLLTELETNQQTLNAIQARYNTIDETIAQDAKRIKKKYGKTRITRLADDYLGYVAIRDQGIIHFSSQIELATILENNNRIKELRVVQYHDYLPNRAAVLNGRQLKVTGALYHEMGVTEIVEYPNNPVTFCRIDDTVSFVPGAIFKSIRPSLIDPDKPEPVVSKMYTTNKFYGIQRNGVIIESTTNQFSQRKSLSRGAKSTLIYTLPRQCKDTLIFHMDPAEPNVIRIDHILQNNHLGRCTFVPGGQTIILDAISATNEWVYLNLADSCLNKVSFSMLFIQNPHWLIKKKQKLIHLTRGSKDIFRRYFKKHPTLNRVNLLILPE